MSDTLLVDDIRLVRAQALLPYGLERTPAWYIARRAGIGASDMAAVLGLSKYASPYSLYYEKTEAWDSDEEDPADAVQAMRLGRSDEVGITEIFEERYPEWTVHVPPGSLWKSRAYHPPWLIATPDRLLTLKQVAEINDENIRLLIGSDYFDELMGDPAFAGLFSHVIPLEIKSMGGGSGWGTPHTDEFPLQYVVQLLQQCLIFGAPFGILVVRLGKRITEYIIRVDQHRTLVDEMLENGAKFMEHITKKIEPIVDGHEATTDALRKVYPAKPDTKIDYDNEEGIVLAPYVVGDLVRLRARIKRAEAEYDSAKNSIRELLGDKRYATDGQGKVVAKRTVYTRRPYQVKEGVVDRIDFTLPNEEGNDE